MGVCGHGALEERHLSGHKNLFEATSGVVRETCVCVCVCECLVVL